MFEYFSSPMIWCETKLGQAFMYSPYIVEFWNSITSLLFCFFAILGYINHRHLNLDNIPWMYLFMIGITSTLFHSTLSFIGQFLDELFIILLITYCLRIFFKINIFIYIIISLFLSGISWFYPSLSPPILMFFGFFLVLSTYLKLSNSIEDQIWYKSIYIGILSVFTWILDFLCIFNTHMYWHIFICISAYYMILFILKDSNQNLHITNEFFSKLRLKI